MNHMKNLKKMLFAVTIATILPLLTACGDNGGGNGHPGQPNGQVYLYTVGGTISGLDGTLVLQNNGGNSRTAYANGSFTFFSSLADGTAYNVTVSRQPLRQTCTVYNGSGTIRAANVTNIQVMCANNTGGVTLSGRIAVPPGVVIDNSVNDLNESYDEYNSNTTFESAQVLRNPISVGGYVNRPGSGPVGRFNNRIDEIGRNGNPNDYYLVQLKTGDAITLAIGESNTTRNNLDLYLYDGNRNLVAASVGTGTYEFIEVRSDGTYFVNVRASSGASNYILTIGADTTTADIASADPGILSTQREIVPDQVIVRFKDTVKTAALTNRTFSQYTADVGLTVVAGSPEREMLMSIDRLKFQGYADDANDVRQKSYEQISAGNQEVERLLNTLLAVKELREQPDVISAEPNYIVRTYNTVPDDPHYGLQWNLPLINLPEAWNVTTGSDDVIVAVVDSGVLMSHPDLSGRLTNTGYSFVSGEAGGTGPNPNDPGDKGPGTSRSSFHGTHVAGIIAASTNNNVGVAGVTWNTMIMPVRVVGAGGSGSVYDVMQGIRYAAGLDNDSGRIPATPPDIINLSLGGAGGTCVYQDVINRVRAQGIIIVAAAGNDNRSTPSYPAACNGVISVSAVNINGTKASYSNYGSTINVAAPGGDSGDLNGDGYQDYIWSTGGDDSSGSVAFRYTLLAGTSMAAPHVAGVAALMKAVYPGLSPQNMDDLLALGSITDDIGTANYYGNGLINAFKAVAAAQELAGGGSIAGLDINPRTINFGAALSEASVTLSRIGTGALSVTDISKNADWLTVVGESVDGAGFGSYAIRIDRASPGLQQEGAYTASITFTSSSGISASAGVTVQVRRYVITYDAGVHYVLLYRIKDDGSSEFVDEYGGGYGVKASDGYYSYAFNNVQPGEYWIVAGSDRNNDYNIVDGGEAYGFYPSINQIDPIEVGNSDIIIPDFATNLMLSISGNNIDNLTLSDKPAALPPEFRRFMQTRTD